LKYRKYDFVSNYRVYNILRHGNIVGFADNTFQKPNINLFVIN